MTIIAELEKVILDRRSTPRKGSYTCHLFEKGIDEIVKKVGEESVEVILAGLKQNDTRLAEETADLVYHLLVLLAERGVPWAAVEAELVARRK